MRMLTVLILLAACRDPSAVARRALGSGATCAYAGTTAIEIRCIRDGRTYLCIVSGDEAQCAPYALPPERP